MVDDRTSLMTARALAEGTEVLWYTIEKVLGQGGFGITYLAHDQNLDRSVAIKEYLPTPFAYRHQDVSVKPLTTDHTENFAWGLDSFQKEAQTLAKFKHNNIVQVHSVFQQNNTAYMVMAYEHGSSLASIFRDGQQKDQAFFEQIFFPIFDGLEEIHKFGFIHRDIKPANIYIRENQTPVLIDFGSARQTSQQQTGQMTALVTQGYTPLEQYSPNYGDQGPWTDIYALAATIYEGIVGRKPDESLSRSACMLRSKPDSVARLTPEQYPGFRDVFLGSVHVGLALEPEMRPQNLAEWSAYFESKIDLPSRDDSFSGFTQLVDDDRTRIRPRQTAASPNTERKGSSSVPSPSQPRSNTGVTRRTVNTFSFDSNTDVQRPGIGQYDSKLAGESWDSTPEPSFDGGQTRISSEDMQQPAALEKPPRTGSTVQKPTGKSGSGKMIATGLAVAVLAVGGGGLGYYFLTNSEPSQTLTSEIISALPTPVQSVKISLPETEVLGQLDQIAILGGLYQQAKGVNPSDQKLLSSIDRSYTELAQIATDWNAGQHTDISRKVLQISKSLPGTLEQRNRISALVESSDQRSDLDALTLMIAEKKIVQPSGNSVIDSVSKLSQTDFEQLKGSEPWIDMMNTFKNAAVAKLESSDFDGAAKIVEAALAIQPDQSEILLLHDHIVNR